MVKKERHFVLVHGACHGAWCWYKVATQLKLMGHKVSAIDMAGSGIHPKQVHEIHSISDYFEPLMEFLASLPPEERVILVGHSNGGYCISAAMEKFPKKLAVTVFATAFMPGPNFTYQTTSKKILEGLDLEDTEYGFHNGPDKPPTSMLLGPRFMATRFYQLSPPEDLMLALNLARPISVYKDEESNEATTVTQEKYGSVRRVYILCKKDNIMEEDFQRWMIESNPPDECRRLNQKKDSIRVQEEMVKTERHFVLVHGASHGAWCWYKVATQLKLIGHKVSALDMAGSGINPKQVHEIHSISDYFEPLMEFMASLPPEEKVILVGHSKGGNCISAAMERFPEKLVVAVFAAAYMPGPKLTYQTIYKKFLEGVDLDKFKDTEYRFHNGPDKPSTSVLVGPSFMATKFYNLSPPEDLTLALSLVRPVSAHQDEESYKATAVTQEKYGSVRRVYILCNKDNIMKEDFQKWMIENNPPDEVKVISDSDHMVMFSQPNQLCSCLQEIADKYT